MEFKDYFKKIEATGLNVFDGRIILYKNEKEISTLYFAQSILEIDYHKLFIIPSILGEMIYGVMENGYDGKNWIYFSEYVGSI